jgi:hypothetical protein
MNIAANGNQFHYFQYSKSRWCIPPWPISQTYGGIYATIRKSLTPGPIQVQIQAWMQHMAGLSSSVKESS